MAIRAEEAIQSAKEAKSETLRLDLKVIIAAKYDCYGELAKAKPLLEETIQIARSINHKPALLGGLVWRGQIHFFQTEYERSEQLMTETRALAEELRDGFQLLHGLFFLGLIAGNMGRISEAFARLKEAIEMAQRNGDHFWVSRLPNCIGWIHRELQDFATRSSTINKGWKWRALIMYSKQKAIL